MATIALPPPRPAFVRVSEGLAQGAESRNLEENAEKVLRHWSEPGKLVRSCQRRRMNLLTVPYRWIRRSRSG